MPALVDPAKCNRNREQCFPTRMCPQSAFAFDESSGISIESSVCSDFHGPCVNFCDGYAILYDRNLATFDGLKRQVIVRISNIPTIPVFDGGQLIDEAGGALPSEQLRSHDVRVISVDEGVDQTAAQSTTS